MRTSLRLIAGLLLVLAGCSKTTLVPPPAQPTNNAQASASSPATNRLVIHADQPGAVINRNIYGQFAEHLGHCIYEGIWVGTNSSIPNTRGIRNDVVAALKNLQVPVLRWPGGCFADEYHWKDGIGPAEKRPAMINTTWGGVTENNSFGTHEFMDLCEQLGCEPYICGNVGSGSPQEMMEWLEYLTSDASSPMANLRRANGRDKPWRVKYFGVGNESWGCGGNMRAEFYADNFRRYNTFIKNYPGNKVYRIACGPNGDNYGWMETLMKQVGRQMNALSLHHYSLPTGNWKKKGSATDFTEGEWFSTLRNAWRMEEYVTKHAAIMDKYDPEKKIGLAVDEWGAWYDVEPGTNPGFLYQQSTLRDALVAAVNLDIFNRRADRVVMANIAQMVNVLQAMILTDKEKMLLTPTYHVFEMFKVHQGATSLPVDLQCADYARGKDRIPGVSVSASRDQSGKIHLSLANLNPNETVDLPCELNGAKIQNINGRILTGDAMQAHNTFDQPDAVKPGEFKDFTATATGFKAKLPAKSVVVLEIN